jgi:hypothetical protein
MVAAILPGMRARWLILSPLLLAATVAACGPTGDAGDKPPGTWTGNGGKGDGTFDLVEAGPANVGGDLDVTLDGSSIPAYRVESFGGTQLTIDLTSASADPYLVVEGPLPDDGDQTPVGTGTVVAEDDDSGVGNAAHLDLTLDQPGVYRVLVGTYDSLETGAAPTGDLDFAVTCGAQCYRSGLDQKTFVRGIIAQQGDAFAAYAKTELANLVHDPDTAAQLGAQLDQILADPDLTGLERFPTLPLSAIPALRPALDLVPSDPPQPQAVVHGELSELLGDCTPDRSLPAEATAELPGVRYGQFPSVTLSPCQFAHSSKLAGILTSLAAQNGSSITVNGVEVDSPADLAAALVSSGHTIEVRSEHMYANFLSFIVPAPPSGGADAGAGSPSSSVGEQDLIWPAWIDTGITLSSGESLTIPMGHSQYAWRISGPLVNTRVSFFLGISGAGFFANTDSRPAWTGMTTTSDVVVTPDDSADYPYLIGTLNTASAYLRRILTESTTVASGLPADGYGYVGVCNDSNATIETATLGNTEAFPLLRARSLDTSEGDLGDGLDDVMRSLPKDGDGIDDEEDALRRAVVMQPFADGSPLMWDAALGAQIATARGDLGQ